MGGVTILTYEYKHFSEKALNLGFPWEIQTILILCLTKGLYGPCSFKERYIVKNPTAKPRLYMVKAQSNEKCILQPNVRSG